MKTRFETYNEMHPYGTEGIVHKVEKNNKEYVIVNALNYVIDDYDEYLGSVELSHYDHAGYDIVKAFDVVDVDEKIDLLDFTWMSENDIIDLENSPINKEIRQININLDNLEYINLPVSDGQLQNLSINLYANNSKKNIIKTIIIIKNFLAQYSNEISGGIELIGFNPIIMQLIISVVNKYNVELKSSELEKIIK